MWLELFKKLGSVHPVYLYTVKNKYIVSHSQILNIKDMAELA